MPENTATPTPGNQDRHNHAQQELSTRRVSWAWWVFAAIALFYLLSEHRAHLFGILPYLLLLACPLMHLFMHHGHGQHGSHDTGGKDGNTATGGKDEPR
ncbi:MAG: DUF2933 domain-containing protein [Rhodocyclaceae bacterium]|nr:DUF2933 domain-containing protein [Rhodocyclaceae bacterium]MBX3670942.1 DUF2933 domain-containing protein [Rhodocyclaceae bacterium]